MAGLKLTLGYLAEGFPLWPGKVTLKADQLAAHMHVLGVSGTGKSKFLESIWMQLFLQKAGVTFIDPHGDSADYLMDYLTHRGYFKKPGAFERLLYIKFSEEDWFLPLNILRQKALPHTIAGNFREALHRAWPALSGGAAPMFDTLVQDGVKVLISNELPVTCLYRLLTDKAYREQLLEQEDDIEVVTFFRNQFDRMSQRDQVDAAGAALRRAHLLTFNPALRYSLGQQENRLDLSSILDNGVSVLINLGGVQDQEARRLLGCLLTIGYEQAALSREASTQARTQHHLIIDEMGEFVANSEQGLSRMLSQTRKYNLFTILAHQTWSQTTARLRGALQNAQLEVAFGIGREDAEGMSRAIGRIDVEALKSDAKTEYTQPIFKEVSMQWEEQIQQLIDLPKQHAIVRARTKPAVHIKTLSWPKFQVDREEVEEVKEKYRELLMRPMADIKLVHQEQTEQTRTSRSAKVGP